MSEINLKISEDKAAVLFEFYARLDDKERLYFIHPAKYIELMKIAGQIDKSTSIMFSSDYGKLLQVATDR